MIPFRTELVKVAVEDQRKAVWEGIRKKKVRGTEHILSAIDCNYLQRNRWSFRVRVPNKNNADYVGVQPVSVPNRKVWAGLERRNLQFGAASVLKYRRKLYAKLFVADANGHGKHILNEGKKVPPWIDSFHPIPKRKVASSEAFDGRNLVAVVREDDFATMIKIFIAVKAWWLDQGHNPHPAWTEQAKRERSLISAAQLNGMCIAVTRALARGPRRKIFRWLKELGADPKNDVSRKVHLLVVGTHYLEDDRLKIVRAKELGIEMLSESRFYRKYDL